MLSRRNPCIRATAWAAFVLMLSGVLSGQVFVPSAAAQERSDLNTARDHVDFAEVPIKLYLRKRESSDPTDEIEAKLKRRGPGTGGQETGAGDDEQVPTAQPEA